MANTDYRKLFKVSKPTASRDLYELSDELKIIEKIGTTGIETYYTLKGS